MGFMDKAKKMAEQAQQIVAADVERHEPDYRQLDRELLRGWQSVPSWMFE